jgi:tetratricopeptide (TPR) repeat protein
VTAKKSLVLLLGALALPLSVACEKGRGAADPPVSALREAGARSKDPEEVGRWLLGELVSSGGDTKQAAAARRRLESLGGRGLYASMARGLDASAHGQLGKVSEAYLDALLAARDSRDPRAPVFAWLAAHEASGFHHASPGFWERHQGKVEGLLQNPGRIGWRARLDLAEWWARESRAAALTNASRLSSEQQGCVTPIRLAGVFGRDAARDTLRSYPPEQPGPWPERWTPDPDAGVAPHVLKTRTEGCRVTSEEGLPGGITYAETFVDIDARVELVVAVQGAFAVWVDDTEVLRRDVREWGAWLKFGVRLELEPGRHRILAKLGAPSTSIRLFYPSGKPYGHPGSIDGSKPYVTRPPLRVALDNPLDAWVKNGDVRGQPDDLVRFFGGRVAHIDDQPDVAAVLLEPLVAEPRRATGLSLSVAALFAESDPAFADGQRRDLARELGERALARDPGLWQARLAIASGQRERSGPIEAARAVAALVDEFPAVPAVLSELVRLYRELGWSAEYGRAARELARRFPDDPDALELAVAVLDEQGEPALADRLAERIAKLDPDSEVALSRALARADFKGALAELGRLAKRRPDRKDITDRIHDVMVRAGNASETWKKLEAAISKDPRDEAARLALADARYASGSRQALVEAVVASVKSGAATERLAMALDLVEGATELEPYRVDTETAIGEYERSGVALGGTAARVLDYSAVWVKNDGSSRMLEHEIVRVQTAEAITVMAEQPLKPGVFLKLRVRKKDGSILEPELVSGKPTVTMPHLELGDYIETERIESQDGDGRRGKRYVGPRWFFREENVAYARSEFVVISPRGKELQVETKNEVPAATVTEAAGVVVRRWRVDRSEAAPVEPFGAPITEFLPSVQIGWGVSLDATLRSLSDGADDLTPVDPRVRRVAERIVAPLPRSALTERARKLYRWITSNVEEGEEDDGRRVIMGKNGNLWRGYLVLCRALGIPVDYAVVQNRLTLPPTGPFSEAMVYTQPLLRLRPEKGELWLTLGSKHAPFGYVPSEARGMPAVVFGGDQPIKTRTPTGGALDHASTEGTVALAADGSATLELVQSFHGKYATGLRGALTELPERQIRDAIESRLLGGPLRGVELARYEIEGVSDPDAPIRIKTRSKSRAFAQPVGGVLIIQPPAFGPRLSQLATLAVRQTPLIIVDASSQSVNLTVSLPRGATLEAAPSQRHFQDGERRVDVLDRAKGGELVLERRVMLPAGRVQPGAYPSFLEFTRRSDEATTSSFRVRLR